MQRNTVAYSAAIRACEKGEQWQQTLELFARMPGEGVRRYTITCSAAINACEKGEGEQWQHNLEFFARMPGEGVWRNTITCSAAMNACEKGGEWQQTLDVSKGVVIGEENMRRAAYTNAEKNHCMSSDTRSLEEYAQ